MGGKDSAPPPPDYSALAEASEQSAKYSYELAKRQQDWAEKTYNENKDVSDIVIGKALDALDKQTAWADKDRERYENIYQPLEEVRRHLEVNMLGALAVTQAFAPLLGTDRARTGKPGRIINISSVSGRISAPFLGAYAASKRALEGMSHSLRRELMLFGIDVVIVNPGSVVTPIWDKAERIDGSRYETTAYWPALQRFWSSALRSGRAGLPAERVGEVVLEALTARTPRTSYPVVRGRLRNWTIPLALPARVIDRLIAKRLGVDAEPR